MPQENIEHRLTSIDGRIDITEESIWRGDTLKIDGKKQKVIDIFDGSLITNLNGKEIEYKVNVDLNKSYLIPSIQ